ncbi:MAG: Bax inhibitor-1/YccA family protein, partial [Alphaproteobacteria bacterium]|nr:Bax inhibitor-1/YccA family protein [Alphaproteobacteria bacterium]
MSDQQPRQWGGAVAQPASDVINEGERAFMLRVFNWMALAVAFTGAVSLFVASVPVLLAFAQGAGIIGFFAIIGLGLFAPRIIATKSLNAAQITFWAYAGLWGFFIAPIINLYLQVDPGLLVRAFFITSATFAGVSLYGYTTKRNLTRVGTFAVMMILGVLVAAVVNLFVGNQMLDLLISVAVVGLFSAVTAWEVQSLRQSYYDSP